MTERAPNQKSNVVGWGVIGSGGIAAKRTIPGMRLSKRSRLVGVTGRDPAMAKAVAGKFGARAYENIAALLAESAIQAVYIASPVFLHAEHVRQAADAGKHILCEKPLGVTIEECKKILRHCERRGVHLMTGFMMRFHPLHQLLRDWVAEGRLGQIVLARAQLSHFHVEWNPDGTPNWRQFPEKSGGGALMDMGIHCVDLLRFICAKEVISVSGRVATVINDYKSEDTGVLLLNFYDKTTAIVDAAFTVQGAQHVIELYGTKGSVFVDNSISQAAAGNIWTAFAGEKRKRYPYKPAPDYKYAMYTREIDEMNDCILSSRQPRYAAREGVVAQAIIQAGYESSRLGKVIRIPKIQ